MEETKPIGVMNNQRRRPIAYMSETCSSIVAVLALALVSVLPAYSASTLYMLGNGVGHLSGLWTVNVASGAATYVGPIVDSTGDLYVYAGGIAYDSYRHTLYVSGASYLGVSMLYSVNQTTGAATAVGPSGGSTSISLANGGLAFDPVSHKLYALGEDNTLGQHTGLYEVSPLTGAATLIGATRTAGAYLYGLGIDPTSGILYANGTNDFLYTPSKLFTLNAGSGAETVIGTHGISLGRQMYYGGIAFDPGTGVCYSVGSITGGTSGLYTLSTTTGTATLVGDFIATGSADGGLAFVPDPATSTGPLPHRACAHDARGDPFINGYVRRDVVDVAGRRVSTVFRGTHNSGDKRNTWSVMSIGFGVPVGGHFVRLINDR